MVLVFTVVVTPFLLMQVPGAATEGLATAFVVLLIWVLFTNSEMGKAFVSGVVLRTLIAFEKPFQVGDRVTIKGYGGKVLGRSHLNWPRGSQRYGTSAHCPSISCSSDRYTP